MMQQNLKDQEKLERKKNQLFFNLHYCLLVHLHDDKIYKIIFVFCFFFISLIFNEIMSSLIYVRISDMKKI